MPKVVYTKEFNSCLSKLLKSGKKRQADKARAAQAEAASDGKISCVQRTNHGENRLPNIEKYDLGEGFRLVVQLVDSEHQVRAFLYVGDHEDAEMWLETHKNYRWIQKQNDKTLEFVQITESKVCLSSSLQCDQDSPESLLKLPLLREIKDDEWKSLSLNDNVYAYVSKLTAEDWQRDPDGIMDYLASIASENTTYLIIDLLHHAYQKEFSALHHRINFFKKEAQEIKERKAAEAMLAQENSESFITWEDSKDLFDNHGDTDWANWMLFLHPEQKKLVNKDLNGPARLRGVSGSGKTSVMVHRARYLAKKYAKDILVITLTESMRKLLDSLLDALCGVERQLIVTSTIASFSKDLLTHLQKEGHSYTSATPNMLNSLIEECTNIVKKHPDYTKSSLHQFSPNSLKNFIKDEISYVRGRLLENEYHLYVSKTFKRQGRSSRLSEWNRQIILPAIEHWNNSLRQCHQLDHEAIIQEVVTLLLSRKNLNLPHQWRCILVDEVQDLSQLELRLLANIPSSENDIIGNVENGLFLVGDGAQTIYKKGFSLQNIGINVSNRSFVFKKNYRNTHEILLSAYGLIKDYEFADIDEDHFQKPLEPDYAVKHGEKPMIVKCRNLSEESIFCASRIKEMITNNTYQPGQICIIGLNKESRKFVKEALQKNNIQCIDLKQDVDFSSNSVKISTIESAKGHEFQCLFIIGVTNSNIPKTEEDTSREAARLYVAMTRACSQLYLTYSTNSKEKPSQFLSSIQPYCDEFEYRNNSLIAIKE